MAKSVILVGKTASKIRFNHNIKLKRAINADTLERMVGKVDFAVIESIDSREEDQIKAIIEKFKADNKPVYFFPSISDEVTLGLADELDYTIYSTLDTLCSAIESELKITVKPGYTVVSDVDSSNDFGQTFEMSEALKELDAKDLLSKSVSVDKNSNGLSGENIEQGDFEAFGRKNNPIPADFDLTGTSVPKPESLRDIPEVDEDTLQADLAGLPESVTNEINRLKLQLSDLNYDYSVAVSDMRVATERIANLEKIVNTLKDEKESMQAEFRSILDTNDVLEDPVSLSTYQKTLEDLNARDAQVEKLNAQVTELKQKIEEDKATISAKLAEIEDLTTRLNDIENQFNSVNDSITSGEIHKDVVADFTAKIDALRAEKDETVREVEELRAKASSDTSTIGLLNKNLALETQYRYSSIEMFIELVGKLSSKVGEFNELASAKISLEEKLADSEQASEKLSEELTTVNGKLEELGDIENRLNEALGKLEAAESELSGTKAKLDVALSELASNETKHIAELKAKESEYNEALNKYIEDASRVLEEIKHDNSDKAGKLEKKIEGLEADIETKDAKLTENETTISELRQQTESDKQTIDELNQTVDCLNGVVESKDAQIKSNGDELAKKDKTIDELNKAVADRDSTIKSRDYTILEKDRELAVRADDIKALNAGIEALEVKHAAEVRKHTETIDELNKKVEELSSEISSKEYTIGIQCVALEEREADIAQLNADIEDAKKNNMLLEDKVKRADERFRSTLERLKISGGDIDKLMADAPGGLSADDIRELNEKLEKAESDLESANIELEKIKSDYASLTTKYNENVQQLTDSANALSVKTAELNTANITIQGLTSRVEQLENEKSTLESVRDGASSSEVEAIKNQNSTLVEKNSALTAQLNESLAKETEQKRHIAHIESELETYKSLVSELQSGIGSSGGQCAIGNINYNKGAQIISVFGNRSCGITTLAVSIARKLSINTNVLYIDFDMIAPKGDVIFKKTPIVEIRGGKNTSLGAMTQIGNSLTTAEIRSLAIDVEKTKGGNLSYFSGYYWKPNDSVIAGTDFSRLFEVLGDIYDYIIVDLGKIGASSFNNSIITEIINISRKSIVISNNDQFNVKALLRSLNSVGIDPKRLAWAINKVPEVQVGSQTVAVNGKILELLNGCKVSAFADDLKLRGLPSDFLTCARSNKLNFDVFLAQNVFG